MSSLDTFQRAKAEAAAFLAAYNFEVRCGKWATTQRARAAYENAVRDLSNAERELKEKLSAVLSDSYHRGENLISAQRAAELAGCMTISSAEILQTLVEPIEPGRCDFFRVSTLQARCLTY